MSVSPSAALKGAKAPAEARGEHVCVDCGYGVYCSRPPERCPMCLGTGWRAGSWLRRYLESDR